MLETHEPEPLGSSAQEQVASILDRAREQYPA